MCKNKEYIGYESLNQMHLIVQKLESNPGHLWSPGSIPRFQSEVRLFSKILKAEVWCR